MPVTPSRVLLDMTRLHTIITPYQNIGWPPKTVGLSFDDGPNGEVTARLLDVLARHGVMAAFCVVGRQVERYPELVRRMAEEGHLLVNHSYAHPTVLPAICRSMAQIDEEIDRTDRAIAAALGQPAFRARDFRPPGGVMSGAMHDVVDQRGLRVLPVTFLPLDMFYTPRTAGSCPAYLMRHIRRDNGALLVIHDDLCGLPTTPWLLRQTWCNANRTWVPAAVDQLLDLLKAEGYAVGVERLTASKDAC